MITPELFGIMCRAARRAVRKYGVTRVVIGREKCSTSSSVSGV
jgi:hypothetical protein